MKSTRREFVKTGIYAAAAAGVAASKVGAAEDVSGTGGEAAVLDTTRKADMVYRKIGRTGETVSLVGLGGFHIGSQKDEQESIRIIRSAIDRGITFLDNCWDYNGGQSEI